MPITSEQLIAQYETLVDAIDEDAREDVHNRILDDTTLPCRKPIGSCVGWQRGFRKRKPARSMSRKLTTTLRLLRGIYKGGWKDETLQRRRSYSEQARS